MALVQGNFSFDYYNVSSNTGTPSPGFHKYGSTDTYATITASGYFDDLLGDTVYTTLQPAPLRVQDCILIAASDQVEVVKITAVDPNITVSPITGDAPPALFLPQNQVYVGNASNQAAAVPMSGDLAIVSSGATTIQPLAVTTGKIAALAVDSTKLGALAVTTAKIDNLAVDSTKLAALAVTTAKIDNLAVDNSKLAALAVDNSKVAAAAAIDFSKLAALPSAQVLVGSVGNVATATAMSGDVTISNGGVTTIGANAVTTAKILDANVTLAKLSAGATYVSRVVIAGADTYGGGGTSFAANVPGVVATDSIAPNIISSSNAVSLTTVVPSANTITFNFSADPGATTVLSYVVFRVAS